MEGDEEITLEDLKKNQRKLNARKHADQNGLGKDWKHDSRIRERMLSDALPVCPMWLLIKCHKGWNQKSG